MSTMSDLAMREAIPENQLEGEYFRWLCDLILVDKGDSSYWMLAKELWSRYFFWFLPNDDNRVADGYALRGEFFQDYRVEYIQSPYELLGNCRVLEVLIALARRMEFASGDAVDACAAFWEIMGNLGLESCTDENWYHAACARKVDGAINRWMDRRFQMSGRFSPFPLRSTKKDQRKTELWMQMQEYIIENYP